MENEVLNNWSPPWNSYSWHGPSTNAPTKVPQHCTSLLCQSQSWKSVPISSNTWAKAGKKTNMCTSFLTSQNTLADQLNHKTHYAIGYGWASCKSLYTLKCIIVSKVALVNARFWGGRCCSTQAYKPLWPHSLEVPTPSPPSPCWPPPSFHHPWQPARQGVTFENPISTYDSWWKMDMLQVWVQVL